MASVIPFIRSPELNLLFGQLTEARIENKLATVYVEVAVVILRSCPNRIIEPLEFESTVDEQ